MLSCMTTPADLLFHAARFSLERLDWLASDMRRALGLGRLPCLPFLARWQLRQLTRFLAHAEPLLRRLILQTLARWPPVRRRIPPPAPRPERPRRNARFSPPRTFASVRPCPAKRPERRRPNAFAPGRAFACSMWTRP
jgi:hypothetical protein